MRTSCPGGARAKGPAPGGDGPVPPGPEDRPPDGPGGVPGRRTGRRAGHRTDGPGGRAKGPPEQEAGRTGREPGRSHPARAPYTVRSRTAGRSTQSAT